MVNVEAEKQRVCRFFYPECGRKLFKFKNYNQILTQSEYECLFRLSTSVDLQFSKNMDIKLQDKKSIS